MNSKQKYLAQTREKRSGDYLLIVALFLSVLGIAFFFGETAQAFTEQAELKERAMVDGNVFKGISVPVVSLSLEFISSLGGTILFAYVLIVQKKREKWLIPILMIYPILSLASFPIGPIIALGLIVHALLNFRSFLSNHESSEQDSELNSERLRPSS